MALQSKELFGAAVPQLPNLRAYPHQGGISVGQLAALGSDADVANLTPMQFSSATGLHSVWSGGINEVSTITSDGTPATAGDFTLSLEGETSAPIAFDADAAIVQAALEAMSNIAPGDVSAADSGGGVDLGDASHVVTLSWGGALAGLPLAVSADMAGLTGNAHVLAEATAGAGSGQEVDALLWAPDVPHAGLAAGETLIQLLKRGVADARDVPLPAGESQATLDASLKAMSLRQKGLTIQGLSGVA